MPWMNQRAKKNICALLTVALVLHLHCSKWHWPLPTAMNHRKAERSYWMCQQKGLPAGLSAGKRVKKGGVEWERIPLLQRDPDTGILLNKASIVQRKHAVWHKKWQEMEKPHVASDTYLYSDLGIAGLQRHVHVRTVCLFMKTFFKRDCSNNVSTQFVCNSSCWKKWNSQTSQESNGVQQGEAFWFCNFSEVVTQDVPLGYHKCSTSSTESMRVCTLSLCKPHFLLHCVWHLLHQIERPPHFHPRSHVQFDCSWHPVTYCLNQHSYCYSWSFVEKTKLREDVMWLHDWVLCWLRVHFPIPPGVLNHTQYFPHFHVPQRLNKLNIFIVYFQHQCAHISEKTCWQRKSPRGMAWCCSLPPLPRSTQQYH